MATTVSPHALRRARGRRPRARLRAPQAREIFRPAARHHSVATAAASIAAIAAIAACVAALHLPQRDSSSTAVSQQEE